MPIFEVEYTNVAVIQAPDRDTAYKVAKDNEQDILQDTGSMTPIITKEIKNLLQLRDGWDGDCFPYGGDENARLKDLLPEF